jgi:phage replication O-like protein O
MSYTRIPNKIIDDLQLNPYQFQIFSIIIRKTDGWCKAEDGISLSQFEKLVTFKKNKIINTIKELIELELIEKKMVKNQNGSQSFNIYKVSDIFINKINDRVVSENNRGSCSEQQGVVSENNRQKKLEQKKLDNNKKSTKKEKIIQESFKECVEEKYHLKNLLQRITDFYEYRQEIKSLNTKRPIIQYVKTLYELKKLNYNLEECISNMKNEEWHTLKVEYIHKPTQDQSMFNSKRFNSKRKTLPSEYIEQRQREMGFKNDFEDAEIIE